MSLHTKNSSMQLPFTQLWYNRSKQQQKQNKVLLKRNKAPKIKLPDKQPIQNKKRLSYGNIAQKCSQTILSNLSIDNLSYISKQNQHLLDNKNIQQNNNNNNNLHQDFTRQYDSMVLDQDKINKKYCNTGVHSERNNDIIPDKVLHIIQANVIPFMVDKFVDLQERMCIQITKMQQVIEKQNKQIEKLEEQNKNIKQLIIQNYNKQQINKFPDIITNTNQQIPQNNQQNIKQINNQLTQLLQSIQHLKQSTQQKISSLDTQLKKTTTTTKELQQKIQIQFAQRILQLISTYNDNFVDLDKRVTLLEKQVLQDHHKINQHQKNHNQMFGFKPKNKQND